VSEREITFPDQVRWFDALGQCGGCTRPATGKLMGPRNESYGAYCRACADKRLAKAKKAREDYRAAGFTDGG
jgi:hypothetical protein